MKDHLDKILPVEFFTVKTILFMKAVPDRVWKVSYGNLQAGTKVKKIGKYGRGGGETSGHRVDEWVPWVEYEGTIPLKVPGLPHSTVCIVFKLPPGGMLSKEGTQLLFDVYVIYHVVDTQHLMRNGYGKGTVRHFSSVFTEFKTNKIFTNG